MKGKKSGRFFRLDKGKRWNLVTALAGAEGGTFCLDSSALRCFLLPLEAPGECSYQKQLLFQYQPLREALSLANFTFLTYS